MTKSPNWFKNLICFSGILVFLLGCSPEKSNTSERSSVTESKKIYTLDLSQDQPSEVTFSTEQGQMAGGFACSILSAMMVEQNVRNAFETKSKLNFQQMVKTNSPDAIAAKFSVVDGLPRFTDFDDYSYSVDGSENDYHLREDISALEFKGKGYSCFFRITDG